MATTTTETKTRPKSTPDPELGAVRRITGILEKLSPSARQRVLRFAAERVHDDRTTQMQATAERAQDLVRQSYGGVGLGGPGFSV